MTDEQRRSFGNLILLCPTHHTETDDKSIYTVAELKRMRQCHFDGVPYRLPLGPITHRRLEEMKEEEEEIIARGITETSQLLSRFYCRNEWIPNECVRFLSSATRDKLAKEVTTMSLDRIPRVRRFIILLKGLSVKGQPCLLHYYSGSPADGWMTWLLLSLDRSVRLTGNDFRRQLENHVYKELALTKETVAVHELPFISICLKTNRFAPRSVLRTEPKIFCFRYCYATLSSMPSRLQKRTTNVPDKEYRRLKWLYTDSLIDEDGLKMNKANNDVSKPLSMSFQFTWMEFPSPLPMPRSKCEWEPSCI